MPKTRTLILDQTKIKQKINRLAYQLHEDNYDERKLIIAGIAKRGYVLAERIADLLRDISPIKVLTAEVTIDKDNPLSKEIKISVAEKELKNQVVIIADDVINSGKTMIYAVGYFLKIEVKKLHTLALVDRSHNTFPIRADYVGLSLSTTLKEHVLVELGGKKDAVYLE